eukprot:gene31113-33104_t
MPQPAARVLRAAGRDISDERNEGNGYNDRKGAAGGMSVFVRHDGGVADS